MKRFFASIAVLAATVGFSVGFLASPASAAISTVSTTVFDAASSSAWAGNEVYLASAYDTAVVTPDVAPPAGGTVAYSFFTTSDCTGTATSAGIVTLNSDGTVPQSETEGPLNAGTYSFDATYTSTDGVNDSSPASPCELFTVAKATPTTPTNFEYSDECNLRRRRLHSYRADEWRWHDVRRVEFDRRVHGHWRLHGQLRGRRYLFPDGLGDGGHELRGELGQCADVLRRAGNTNHPDNFEYSDECNLRRLGLYQPPL